jgi:hypothetical protein
MDVHLLLGANCGNVFTEPLPSNGHICHIAPSLRLVFRCVTVHSFPSAVLGFTFSRLGFYSPTTPAAPSLRPFATSGSLLRCKSRVLVTKDGIQIGNWIY